MKKIAMKTTYTMEEATALRDKLVIEHREVAQNVKILNSIPNKNRGIVMAIGQYNNRLDEINEELRYIADHTIVKQPPIDITIGLGVKSEDEMVNLIQSLAHVYKNSPEGAEYNFKVVE